MILSDRDIFAKIEAGEIVITSSQEDWLSQVHASSLDLRLGRFFKTYETNNLPILDPQNMPEGNITRLDTRDLGEAFVVHPGDFVLGVTLEKIKLPSDLVARVEGRSSLGRLGIVVHSTAGFIDAGFEGTITLEITNLNRVPVALYPGMRVCQLAFEQMSSPALVPYGEKACSKYQNQDLPEESRVGSDPEFLKKP
ncbi:MAG: dCTP deaminase [Candidatus Peregrinibacteria bacterium]